MEQLEGEFEKPLPVDTAELHAIPDSDDNVEEPTPTGDPNPAPKGTWQILTAHLMEHTMLEEFTNDEDFPDALPLTKAYGVPAHMSKVGILRMCSILICSLLQFCPEDLILSIFLSGFA